MKTFMLDFTKDKEYSQTPTDDYIRKFQYVNPNMRHAWTKETFYRKGDVVFDHLETKNFFILYYEGTSSSVDSIYDDELEWVEYNAMTTHTMTNFNEILLQSDIEKYRNDDKYYDIYNVPTNIKIEQIAYDYYGDTQYWDSILILNNMRTYLELPRSNDVIISKTLEKLKKWAVLFNYKDEDFDYLDNYLNNITRDEKGIERGTWGIYKDIRTTFADETSTGVYYLNKDDLIKVNSYHGKSNVLFHYKNKAPKVIEMTFGDFDSEIPQNPVFPLEVGDKVSIIIKNINLLHNVIAGDSQFLNTSSTSLLPHLDSMLTSADLTGITYNVSYIPGNEKITFQNDPSKLADYSVSINKDVSYRQIPPSTGIEGNIEDVIKINTMKDFSIEYYVQNGYLVEVDDTFVLIDYDNEETVEYYELLLSMYNKYFEEMNTKNNKYQFLKVLKAEFLNEFKDAFHSKRKIVKGIE